MFADVVDAVALEHACGAAAFFEALFGEGFRGAGEAGEGFAEGLDDFGGGLAFGFGGEGCVHAVGVVGVGAAFRDGWFAACHALHHLGVDPRPAADMGEQLLEVPLSERDRGHRGFVEVLDGGDEVVVGGLAAMRRSCFGILLRPRGDGACYPARWMLA